MLILILIAVLVAFLAVRRHMKTCLNKIIRLFEAGNVCVCGLRGRGKDMLFANIIARRAAPYVSNTDYGGQRRRFDPLDFDCGGNTYKNFISGEITPYVYPFADGTDIYISDAGVYFPSQYCSELNKSYGFFSTFMALSRHLGSCNVHFNVQNLNRVWDKIREQSDIYVMCNFTKVFGKGRYVLQRVTVYENYESAVNRVPPYRSPSVRMNADRKLTVQMEKQRYRLQYGEIKRYLLFYRNMSTYETRVFKYMLEDGKAY